MLAEGQVHGGIAQGVGQALMEHVGYDEDGQLLTATFMDYAMPRASDVPMYVFDTEPVPSTANLMGMKGCGEAGTVGAMAATANAVQDALWDRGVRQADMPFTPQRVWELLTGWICHGSVRRVFGWLGRPLCVEDHTKTRKRGPQTHVIILDGTMSTLEPGSETNAGLDLSAFAGNERADDPLLRGRACSGKDWRNDAGRDDGAGIEPADPPRLWVSGVPLSPGRPDFPVSAIPAGRLRCDHWRG